MRGRLRIGLGILYHENLRPRAPTHEAVAVAIVDDEDDSNRVLGRLVLGLDHLALRTLLLALPVRDVADPALFGIRRRAVEWEGRVKVDLLDDSTHRSSARRKGLYRKRLMTDSCEQSI